MGSKSGSSSAPATVTAASTTNDAAMLAAMLKMMDTASTTAAPAAIAVPDVATTTPVDWEAQMEDLGNKAKYEVEDAADARKGRLSTIHSSLTDEGEDTEMTTSLLGK